MKRYHWKLHDLMNFEIYDYFWSLKSGWVPRSMKELFRQKHKPLRTFKKRPHKKETLWHHVNVSQSSGQVCVLTFSCVQLLATLWPVMWQAPLSTGFFRQEYWSGLPFSPPTAPFHKGLNPPLLCLLLCKWILYCWAISKVPLVTCPFPAILTVLSFVFSFFFFIYPIVTH